MPIACKYKNKRVENKLKEIQAFTRDEISELSTPNTADVAL